MDVSAIELLECFARATVARLESVMQAKCPYKERIDDGLRTNIGIIVYTTT